MRCEVELTVRCEVELTVMCEVELTAISQLISLYDVGGLFQNLYNCTLPYTVPADLLLLGSKALYGSNVTQHLLCYRCCYRYLGGDGIRISHCYRMMCNAGSDRTNSPPQYHLPQYRPSVKRLPNTAASFNMFFLGYTYNYMTPFTVVFRIPPFNVYRHS